MPRASSHAMSLVICPQKNLIGRSTSFLTPNHLAGLGIDQFARRGTYRLGQLLHPFREGNGRAQSEFIRHLALKNRLAHAWPNHAKEELYDAAHRILSTENLTVVSLRVILGRFGEQSVCSRLPLVLRLGYTQRANTWVLRRVKRR